MSKKVIIYVLIGVGFGGLIGAHEFAAPEGADDASSMAVPFVLAAAGTLSFVVAGVMAFRMLKRGA